ncbi:hypothetical protein RIF29_18914 [Crotalaria pallida]|uniref:RING-type domain-containing protein n=1 Tax=Crotalaria pallida TaxID=3830 RepID=A0AAN9I516_CROPI
MRPRLSRAPPLYCRLSSGFVVTWRSWRFVRGKSEIEDSSFGKRMIKGDEKLINVDLEREDECGICLEPCTKVVLPNCCHAMCIKCYRKCSFDLDDLDDDDDTGLEDIESSGDFVCLFWNYLKYWVCLSFAYL